MSVFSSQLLTSPLQVESSKAVSQDHDQRWNNDLMEDVDRLFKRRAFNAFSVNTERKNMSFCIVRLSIVARQMKSSSLSVWSRTQCTAKFSVLFAFTITPSATMWSLQTLHYAADLRTQFVFQLVKSPDALFVKIFDLNTSRLWLPPMGTVQCWWHTPVAASSRTTQRNKVKDRYCVLMS